MIEFFFYRLLVTLQNEELFRNAPENNVLYRVFQNNLYSDETVNLQYMLESSKSEAYYDAVDTVVEFKEYKTCKVISEHKFIQYVTIFFLF